MPRWAALRRGIADGLLAQRGRLILWVPICLALGIGGWFSLTFELSAVQYAIFAGLVFLFWLAAAVSGEVLRPILLGLALVGAGAILAGLRAHLVAEPVLGFRYYGPIEGRIVGIDRSASDKVRLTLDRVVLSDMRSDRMPTKVRVSLHGQQGFIDPKPGQTVILTGHLSPPNGPVEPGGFDFRRLAWFQGLGAVGYTRTPVLSLHPAEEGRAGLAILRLRMTISDVVRARMPGAAGAFAAAVMTGDRSAMPREVVDHLRDSNMAHLLAISGLHMGLLTGVVFGLLRAVMALIPRLALYHPIRKFAALGALSAAVFYLMLSGGSVSTQRAFVMVAVMLGAVLLGRRAVSLRSVALAATIILILTPEALFSPGFQMSFAATTALVAVFGLLRDYRHIMRRVPRWLSPVLAVFISSAVAGAATAPFAAAHFNRIADYGLIANLLSVPVMGAVVMPAAVVSAFLWPLGLSFVGLWVMRWGLEWILLVAKTISGLEGSVTHVVTPDSAVLPLIAIGFLFLLIWQGRLRRLGGLAMVVAFALWTQAERPNVLISDTGGLIGVLGPEGRALSKRRGDGFSARNWLENDGDGATQIEASSRTGFEGEAGDLRVEMEAGSLRHLTGRDVQARVGARCSADIIVVNREVEVPPSGNCLLLDQNALRRSGSVALYADGPQWRIVTVRDVTGARLWAR